MPVVFVSQPPSPQGCTCSVASPSSWCPFKFFPEVSSSHVNSRESVTSPNGLKSINQILPCDGTIEELQQATELRPKKKKKGRKKAEYTYITVVCLVFR